MRSACRQLPQQPSSRCAHPFATTPCPHTGRPVVYAACPTHVTAGNAGRTAARRGRRARRAPLAPASQAESRGVVSAPRRRGVRPTTHTTAVRFPPGPTRPAAAGAPAGGAGASASPGASKTTGAAEDAPPHHIVAASTGDPPPSSSGRCRCTTFSLFTLLYFAFRRPHPAAAAAGRPRAGGGVELCISGAMRAAVPLLPLILLPLLLLALLLPPLPAAAAGGPPPAHPNPHRVLGLRGAAVGAGHSTTGVPVSASRCAPRRGPFLLPAAAGGPPHAPPARAWRRRPSAAAASADGRPGPLPTTHTLAHSLLAKPLLRAVEAKRRLEAAGAGCGAGDGGGQCRRERLGLPAEVAGASPWLEEALQTLLGEVWAAPQGAFANRSVSLAHVQDRINRRQHAHLEALPPAVKGRVDQVGGGRRSGREAPR